MIAVMAGAEWEKSLRCGEIESCCAGHREGCGAKGGKDAAEDDRPERRNEPEELAIRLAGTDDAETAGEEEEEEGATAKRVEEVEQEDEGDDKKAEGDCRGTRDAAAGLAARLSIAGGN